MHQGHFPAPAFAMFRHCWASQQWHPTREVLSDTLLCYSAARMPMPVGGVEADCQSWSTRLVPSR
jgi:hypothetical protein